MNPLPLHPSPLLKWAARLTRALLWAVVGVWLVMGLVWGAIHVFIVPRIGDWRAEMETLATQAVGVPVRIGHVAVHTQGLVPSFELTGVRLLDSEGRDALVLGRVVTAVSARSMLRLGFEQIHIAQPTLDVRRTSDGRVLVAGLDLLGARPDTGDDNPVADWFFSQAEFAIQGGTVRWTDDLQRQPPVVLDEVDFVARNPGRQHLLRLDATPQDHLGQRLTLQAVFQSPLLTLHPGRWRQWNGTVHAHLPAVDMAGVSVPAALSDRFGLTIEQGTGSLQVWADVTRGQLSGGTADLALNAVKARFAQANEALALARLQGRVHLQLRPDKVSLETEGLAFETLLGTRWTRGDVTLALSQRPDHADGELRASHINLGALHELSSGLPLAPTQQAQLAKLNPQGELTTLKLEWQVQDGVWQRFSAQGKVDQLALAPGEAPVTLPLETGENPKHVPGRPGFAGAQVDFDMDQDGGKARISMGKGWLSFPGVFEDPHIPMEQLATDVRWQLKDSDIRVQLPNLRFANADMQGQANVQWHTSDPDTSPSGGRFPGVLKLEGTLSRGRGESVHRYLPLVVGPTAQAYVKAAILGGKASQVRFRVAGDIWQVPFARASDGELKVVAQVSGLDFAFVPQGFAHPDDLPWPTLKQASGELVFDRTSMTVKLAKAGVADAPGLRLSQGSAHIANLMDHPVVEVNAQIEGPLSQALGVVRRSPLSAMTAQALNLATGTGNTTVQFGLTVPLTDTLRTAVQGRVSLPGNDIRVTPGSPLLGRAKAAVEFSEKGFALTQGSAQLLGGELAFSGGWRPGTGLQFTGQGTATAVGLAQAPFLGLPSILPARTTGQAAYAVQLGFRHGLPEWSVQSNLKGLAIDLPPPLAKNADQDWSFSYKSQILSAPAGSQGALENAQLGFMPDASTQAHMALERTLGDLGPELRRGRVYVGPRDATLPSLPAQGLLAQVLVPRLDVDAWLTAIDNAASETAATGSTPLPLAWVPRRVLLETGELKLGGRRFHQISMSAQPQSAAGKATPWRADVQGQELAGTLTYQPPHTSAPDTGGADTRDGQLIARLQRLSLTALPTDDPTAAGKAASTPAALPALDVEVESFRLDGRDLGELTLDATNRASGSQTQSPREWLLHRLSLRVPEAELRASGTWAPADTSGSRKARLQGALTIEDTGALLQRFGMPGVFRGGKGELRGEVAWNGTPARLHPPSLSGQLKLDLAAGQFLKADPGLAKLLGVLSLQSLPRRLTLDFSDVFADGFAFDFIRGHAEIAQGVVHTNNLQMKGPNAAVLMEGEADIARETQHIKAVVVPELNAGTASLIATVINPAVGLGTFLAQAVLRQPLISVSSQTFLIHGPWADPQVDKVPSPATVPPSTTPQD